MAIKTLAMQSYRRTMLPRDNPHPIVPDFNLDSRFPIRGFSDTFQVRGAKRHFPSSAFPLLVGSQNPYPGRIPKNPPENPLARGRISSNREPISSQGRLSRGIQGSRRSTTKGFKHSCTHICTHFRAYVHRAETSARCFCIMQSSRSKDARDARLFAQQLRERKSGMQVGASRTSLLISTRHSRIGAR